VRDECHDHGQGESEGGKRGEDRGIKQGLIREESPSHPGVTRTAFGAEDQSRLFTLVGGIARPLMRSPERGADTVVYAASSPELEGITGGYFHDRRPKRSSRASHDRESASRLWQVSEELVGVS